MRGQEARGNLRYAWEKFIKVKKNTRRIQIQFQRQIESSSGKEKITVEKGKTEERKFAEKNFSANTNIFEIRSRIQLKTDTKKNPTYKILGYIPNRFYI